MGGREGVAGPACRQAQRARCRRAWCVSKNSWGRVVGGGTGTPAWATGMAHCGIYCGVQRALAYASLLCHHRRGCLGPVMLRMRRKGCIKRVLAAAPPALQAGHPAAATACLAARRLPLHACGGVQNPPGFAIAPTDRAFDQGGGLMCRGGVLVVGPTTLLAFFGLSRAFVAVACPQNGVPALHPPPGGGSGARVPHFG